MKNDKKKTRSWADYHKLIREFEKIVKLKSDKWTDQDWDEFFKWDKFLDWDSSR